MPTPGGALPTPPAADPEPTGSTGNNASFFDPHTMLPPSQPRADVTGSISRKPAPARPSQPANPPAGHAALDGLPATISPALRTAVAAADPAAEYELGMRYAEGRGMPQSMPEAVKWFERAANAGFAPALFRLASLNEKGDGVKKNTQEARRLYVAAAAKGHAKAMHNLAVLYAEGIDGKPDYKVAADWFRKAAMYGVADSQYNLAILYARGIGMPANLAESYRWFAIAAANGDQDAARKRDEVAARLDKQTLMTAKLAVQSFVPDREPEEATSLKAPPGGWDHAPAPQAKPRRHVPAR
jgi:localization factor PodJL